MLSWDEWVFVGIMAGVPLGGGVFHICVMLLGHGKRRSTEQAGD